MSSDRETLDYYNGSAEKYAGVFSRSEPDQDLSAFMNSVVNGGRVLDLGCGPGNSAAMMVAAGFDVDASDASQGMADLAKEKFDLDVKIETFDDLDAVDLYDGIWANFSLLHAPRAEMPKHLRSIKQALKTDGVFHLGLKLGDRDIRDRLGRFYTHYTEAELLGLLSEAGFQVSNIRHGHGKGMAGTDDPFIIILSHA